jgi:predicted acylesterase/phospholipase RssA/CRP-like cAMP-binding protein
VGNTNGEEVAVQQIDPGPPMRPSLAFLASGASDDAAAVARLEMAASVCRLAPGESFAPAGGSEHDVHVVVEGDMEIRVDGTVLARLEMGQCVVGNAALGDDIDISAVSIVATANATIVTIPESALARLHLDAPAVWRRLHGYFGHQIPSLFLASTEMFRGTDPGLLDHADDPGNWIHLDAGDVLFREGDIADALYLVVHGTLEKVHVGRDQTSRFLGMMAQGEVIGETALLVEGCRTTTVRAIRDSEVVRISREDFERVVAQDPSVGIRVARMLASRLVARNDIVRNPRAPVRTVGLLGHQVAGSEFAADLASALEASGSKVGLVDSARVEHQLGKAMLVPDLDGRPDDRLLSWLGGLEDRFDIVLYACDDEATPWTTWAVRQADVLLVVVTAADGASRGSVESAIVTPTVRARVELVIVHPPGAMPTETRACLATRTVAAHHHLRGGVGSDVSRLARSLNGATIGVTLSGGGARGFAHIGTLQAMKEWGWEIDTIGGTSMGSIIGAQHAMGMSTEEMVERNRHEFTPAMLHRDLTFPMISLVRARRMAQVLRNLFGDACIEDLLLPYFCVSCNLTQSAEVVHDRGPIWLWTRASSAMPGLLPPLPLNGDLLVDGGVLNNLPADVMRHRCTGTVVAVDVGHEADLRVEIPNETSDISGWPLLRKHLRNRGASTPGIMQILTRTSTVSSTRNVAMVRAHADLYLRPPVDDASTFHWDAIDRMVEVGYRYTLESLKTWEDAGRPTPAGQVAEV